MKNRKLLLIVSLILAMTMAMGGTLAYLTDTDEAVNVMTLGNVDIEQIEKDAEGNPFVQSQPLYPAYEDGTDIVGKIEKVVTVENTGSSDAYVRTWMAFEAGNVTELTKFRELIKAEFGFAEEDIHWQGTPVQIEDQKYFVAYIVYPEAVKPGEETAESLKSVYMVPTAGNADVAQFGDTYEILVLSEAVQTKNMETIGAEKALEAAFGTDHPWQEGLNGDVTPQLPTKVVKTAAELREALQAGGTTVVLANDIELDADETITVASGVTARLDLAGHDITADLNTVDADVVTALFSVKKGGDLTINGSGNVHVVAKKTTGRVSATINNEAGNVTINGGNYTMDYGTYDEGYLIPTIVDNNTTLGNATLTINGGTFTHDRNMFRNFANNNKALAKIVINGGSFIADGDGTAAIWNQKPSASITTVAGTVVINGGTFAGVTVDDEFGIIPEEPAGDNVTTIPVVKTAADLAAAVANGATNIMLADGEYDVNGCGGKTLTITGSRNAVIKVMNEGEDGCDYGFGGGGAGVGNVTFNGITIDTTSNTGNYKGFAYMGATFNDCAFVGAYSLNNANDFVFNNCEFDFKNGYFWTWGANKVTFNNCTFNGNSKCILAHGSASTVINIKDCTFAATEKGYTGAGDNTAAVEIDPVGTNVYTINFTGNNTKTESYAGWTRVKDGSTGHVITGQN